MNAQKIPTLPNITDAIPDVTPEGNPIIEPPPRKWIEANPPSHYREWQMPDGFKLVGDFYLTREGFSVIGGAPGVGKSRAALQLAIAGATGEDWFSLPVHNRFKTFILQNENGPHRLKEDFSKVDPAFDGHIRITRPPQYGLQFSNSEFRAALTEELANFQPNVLVIDPFTNVARDSGQGDYSDAFNQIRECLPKDDRIPAVVLVAHTRKPNKNMEKATGRGLLNELIGSFKLGSVPRSAFVMLAATSDTVDPRVIWTCCKNNDGELGPRTAWRRENGLFAPCPDFDFDEHDKPGAGGSIVITEVHMADLFDYGKRSVEKKIAVADLMESTGAGQSAAYNALKLDGRFREYLSEKEKMLSWTK